MWAAFNAAGGVRHHWHAVRYRDSLWRPYLPQVAEVLRAWAPSEPRLVLVGPSAGWLLPEDFLLPFEQVVAIEPDPVARWLLRRRFPQVRWQMCTDDYFTPAGPLPWRENTARLFADFPDQALLFTHFLGQLIGLYPDAVAIERNGELAESPLFRRWKADLRQHLAERSWASLHDRLSSPSPPQGLPRAWSDEPEVTSLRRQLWPSEAVCFDHLTGDLAEGSRTWLHWRRNPQMSHVIEVISRRRSSTQ
jgi:hypothetical protein